MTTPAPGSNPQSPPPRAAFAPVERAVDEVFRALAWRIWVAATLAFLLLTPPETVGHPFFVGAHAVLLALAATTTAAVLVAILRLPRGTAPRVAAALAGLALALELALLAIDVGLLPLDPGRAALSVARAVDGVLLSGALGAFFVTLRATAPAPAVRRRCDRAMLALVGLSLALIAVTVVDLVAPATGAGARWLLAPTLLGAAFYVLMALHGYGATMRRQPTTSAQTDDVPLDAILTHRRRSPALRIVIADEPAPAPVGHHAALHLVHGWVDSPETRRWAALHAGISGVVAPVGARLLLGLAAALWTPGIVPGGLGLAIAVAAIAAILVADVLVVLRVRHLHRAVAGGARAWVAVSLFLAATLLVIDAADLVALVEFSRPDARLFDLLALVGVASRVVALLATTILVLSALATLPGPRRARQSRRTNLIAGLAPGLCALVAAAGWLQASGESDASSLLMPLGFSTVLLFAIFVVQVARSLGDIAEEADDEGRALSVALEAQARALGPPGPEGDR